MLINFRQGILSYQDTPNFFLVLTGGKVNINVDSIPTDITLAHGSTDYLFTESQSIIGAWEGPFINGTDYWIYWDIDNYTGIRTFGTTTINPFQFTNGYGLEFPSNPSIDQHFFNLTLNKMHVWNGTRWAEKIRVFAAKITSGGILQPIAIGSQIGITSKRTAGHILYDNSGLPIKTSDRFGLGYFVTTETYLNSQVDRNNSYKLEALHPTGKAIEPIPQYYCVSWKDVNQLGVASYKDPLHPCIGISSIPMGVNEVAPFITDGFISNFPNWNFTDPPGTILWVGITGEITTVVPQDTSMQEVGYVVSPDTVFINLRRLILIDQLPNITPTPTPTPIPPTPSITPTQTTTPYPTIPMTPSITPTLTPTITPTPTVTPSAIVQNFAISLTDNRHVMISTGTVNGILTGHVEIPINNTPFTFTPTNIIKDSQNNLYVYGSTPGTDVSGYYLAQSAIMKFTSHGQYQYFTNLPIDDSSGNTNGNLIISVIITTDDKLIIFMSEQYNQLNHQYIYDSSGNLLSDFDYGNSLDTTNTLIPSGWISYTRDISNNMFVMQIVPSSLTTDNTLSIIKLLSTGGLITSFGSSGFVNITLTSGVSGFYFYNILPLQYDQFSSIIYFGISDNNTNESLIYAADATTGAFINTFGVNGVVTASNTLYINMKILGNYLYCFTNTDMERYNLTNGTKDNIFGTVSIPKENPNIVYSLINVNNSSGISIDNNAFLISGIDNSLTRMIISRILDDGTLDINFGQNGVVVFPGLGVGTVSDQLISSDPIDLIIDLPTPTMTRTPPITPTITPTPSATRANGVSMDLTSHFSLGSSGGLMADSYISSIEILDMRITIEFPFGTPFPHPETLHMTVANCPCDVVISGSGCWFDSFSHASTSWSLDVDGLYGSNNACSISAGCMGTSYVACYNYTQGESISISAPGGYRLISVIATVRTN